MDYEKKYHEALAWMRESYPGLHGATKEDAEHFFPELRESEDERIRKWIIEELEITREAMSGKHPYSDDPDIVARLKRLDEAISYLEKKKPMYNLEIPSGDVAPAEEDGPFDEDDFLEDELSAFLQNYDKEYDDDAAVSDVARHFYEIGKKQKEQKQNPLIRMMEDNKAIMEDIRNGIPTKTIEKERNVKFATPVDVSHAEWSEEDKEHIESLLKRLDGMCKKGATFTQTRFAVSEDMDWLMLLSKRFNSKKCNKEMDLNDRLEEISRNGLENAHTIDFSKEYKNSKQILEKSSNCKEWSEKDKIYLEGLIEYHDMFPEHQDWTDFLKSLLNPIGVEIWRQTLKNIEDMCDAYEKVGEFYDNRATDFLGNVRVKCKDALETAEILGEPSWKPSKEQMNHLCAVVDAAIRKHNESVSGYEPARVLKSLYEQLKKLM